MHWNQIAISDQAWMTLLFRLQGYPISDYNFTHLFIWKELYQMRYTLLEGLLIVRGIDPVSQQGFIYMPVGSGDFEKAIEVLTEDFQSCGQELTFRAITPQNWSLFRQLFKNNLETISYEMQRSEYEYLYEINQMATYAGGQLSRKRELCKAFEGRYKWAFSPYEITHYEEVVALIDKWHAQNTSWEDPFVRAEHQGVLEVLKAYEELSCMAFVLCVEGVVSGFIIAEALNQDILMVHYEKANRAIKGAYDLMKRELARQFVGDYKWISLEEDMGISGLRTAKQLYRPIELLEKGSLQIKIQLEVKDDGEGEKIK